MTEGSSTGGPAEAGSTDWAFLDYELPPDRIAQDPLEDRTASRLLHLDLGSGQITDRVFRDVGEVLQSDDLLVLNDTRVTALRLIGSKPSGGAVELLVIKRLEGDEFEALARPGKRLQPGAVVHIEAGFSAEVVSNLEEGRKRIRFVGDDWEEALTRAGRVPLPPYIHRNLDQPERYQTEYSNRDQTLLQPNQGSAAAPTAGLHFTTELLQQLGVMGVQIARVTLDVGLDTFRPMTTDDPLQHSIHGETCHISVEAARQINTATGRIIAVGTTATRTLESFAIGSKEVKSGDMDTRIFITPGYKFKIIDGMFTNFHMPRTTMLMMLAALVGPTAIQAAYRHAVTHNYRFLSFGDSMLIL